MFEPLRLVALVLALAFAFSPAARAQESPPLTPDQVRVLLEVKHSLATLDDLERRGVLARPAAETERERQHGRVRALLGEGARVEAALADVDAYLGLLAPAPASKATASPPSEGWFDFVDRIWWIASALLVISLAWLTRLYLVPLLARIPPALYEGLIYAVCAGLMVGGLWLRPEVGRYVALPGCLGLLGGIAFTAFRHREAIEAWFKAHSLHPGSVVSALLFCVWTPVAIAYRSTMLGYLCVAALQSWLGFSVVVTPLCYGIGFRGKEVIPRAMSAAFALLAAYVALRIARVEHPIAAVFEPAALFFGAFVYYTGTVIVASKWYWIRETPSRYPAMQALAIISGVAALLVGSVWDIGALKGVGGTFFFLYLLEKYFELPWNRKTWAWAALGLALILYGSALVVRQVPEYFLFEAR